MMIHEEQQNVRQLCEVADFIDSGFQSFRDQAKLPPRKIVEAAFFCGASLVLKLEHHFKTSNYSPADVQFLTGLLIQEINAYLERNNMRHLEWEPHVPTRWQQ